MDAQQQTEYIFNPKLLLSDIHVGFQFMAHSEFSGLAFVVRTLKLKLGTYISFFLLSILLCSLDHD